MTTKTMPASPPVRRLGSLHLLGRCFGFLKPYKAITIGAYLTLIIINALTLVIPQIIRSTVDQGIGKQNIPLLGWSVLALLGLMVIKGVMSFLQGRWTEVASQGVAYDMRNAIHRKLADLSFAYHDRTETGQLLSRAIQDVERVRFLTGRAFLRLIDAIVFLLGAATILLIMNPRLALLSLCLMPLLAYRAIRFSVQFRPISLAIQQQLAVLTTRLEQNLRGARIVKAYAQEESEIDRFERENSLWFGLSVKATRMQALNMPMLDLIANTGTVFIIWYGGLLVVRHELTLGEFVAFFTYLGQLIQPVRRLGMILPALSQAAAAAERIFEILDAESEVKEAPNAISLPKVRGHVRFERVSFSYFGRHQVLNDVSFEAQPGQIIALMGTTGSGKTSIVNLIPRFYDATSGRISIDGVDVRDVTLNSLRDQIGIVLQETVLFAATIRENIAFGRPGASDEEVIAAAQAAQAHDFICHMPEGYETHVGERGVTLSGGQKQRVAIARAILKNPRILILDDATASVDTETEHQIQLAMERLMRGGFNGLHSSNGNRQVSSGDSRAGANGIRATSFIIAQRLSTVRMADMVLVLEKGRIAARGTHEELLRTSGLYAEIYNRQLRSQEELTSQAEQVAK
ncbi:MAG: ABC transporter ATP-binding protein [Chloroflexi bacterium]|nr:ABC transporter ATP-binding protein [Chloroflexota bacterium]